MPRSILIVSTLSTSTVGTSALAILSLAFASLAARADDMHPAMDSEYWANFGAYFAARDFDASARSDTDEVDVRADFERALGLDDRPELFSLEFGWQFGEKWGVSLQHFASSRNAQRTLEDTIEWEDVSYEAGIDVAARTKVKVTRMVFSRHVWETERQDLRLGVGVHYLEVGAAIAGEARLDDMSTEFRSSAVATAVPVPNIGAWYRYSPSERWMMHARADWFSANIGEFSGGIWNVVAGTNYRISRNFGVGLSYQFFEIDGKVRKTDWNGDIRTRFDGPLLYVSAYW